MAGVASIPRSRGTVCGLLLVLLGAWGALAPFIGPDLHFGYTPDSAFAYTEGRLVLSAVPGGIALLAGLVILLTRSRALGAICGIIATLGGAWFIVGLAVVDIMPGVFKAGAVTPGSVLTTGSATMITLTALSFFAGTGALIVFFGALATGRFSLLAAKDPGAVGTAAAGIGAGYGGYQGSQFPAVQLQYPGADQPAFAADPYADAGQDAQQAEPEAATATHDLGRAQDYAGGASNQGDPQQYGGQQGYQPTHNAGQQQQQQYPTQLPDPPAQQDYQAQQYGGQQQFGGQQYGGQQYGSGFPGQQDYQGAADNPISHEQAPVTPTSQPPFPPAPRPAGTADPTRTISQPDPPPGQDSSPPHW